MKNILLLSPAYNNAAHWLSGNYNDDCDEDRVVMNFLPPVGLATVAAMCPKEKYHVQLWDELVHGVIDESTEFDREWDLVGVTGYSIHRDRCVGLAHIFKKRRVATCVGGPGVSAAPRLYSKHFDFRFVGEAENTWPTFLEDWERGEPRHEYHQIDKPSLDASPPPLWDSMEGEMSRYGMGTVQTTRGCPYDCEFCDVIYLFGRRSRHKPIENVIEELRRLADFGYKWVFFCDDEFGGDPRYTKALCREVIKLNDSLDNPMAFSTQMCITASGDPELCRLLSEANFDLVLMGIESANPESLRGASKYQNLRGDLLENIHRMYSYGIGIRSTMIVGFDQDDKDVFQLAFEFLQKACVPSLGIYILNAFPGTRLWMRLMKERRVVNIWRNKGMGTTWALTNIIPAKMTRLELMRGHRWLVQKAYAWDSFAERLVGFISAAAGARRDNQEPITVDPEQLVLKLHSGKAALPSVKKILDHTERVAPHMMRRVRDLVIQHDKYYKTVQEQIRVADRNIAREEVGELIVEPEKRFVALPVTFKKELARVLPKVHHRVYVNIDDESQIPQALTDIFLEFLLWIGEDFEQFEEQHYTLLDELCDRNVAKYNGVPAVHFTPVSIDVTVAAADVPNIKKSRLQDDIYKNVFVKLNEHFSGQLEAD